MKTCLIRWRNELNEVRLGFVIVIYLDFWHQWHLCLVRCIPGASGRKTVHRDQRVSGKSCPAVVQSKHFGKEKLDVCSFSFIFKFLDGGSCTSLHACVYISESVGVGGEGFSHVPQILGRVQQRSRLHGLLVQVTVLPFLSLFQNWFTDLVCVISGSVTV